MRFVFFVARRYFLSKYNTSAINIISFVSMLAVMVVSMAMLIIFSSLNGFESLVKSLYGTFYPDITISINEGKGFEKSEGRIEKLASLDGIEAFSLVLEEKALLSAEDKQLIAMVKGVDEKYTKVNRLTDKIIRGGYSLKDTFGRNLALIGAGIEARLDLNVADPYSQLKVHIPKRTKRKERLVNKAFKTASLKPKGVFSIQQEFDSKYIITSLPFVQKMLNYNHNYLSSIEVRLKNKKDLKHVRMAISDIYGDAYSIKSRAEMNQALYQVMNMESWAVYCLLTLILVIAGFNILGSLIMLVLDKRKDIFIIRSMGGQAKDIRQIFLLEGVLFSGIGAISGMALAFVLIALQQWLGIVKIPGGTFVVDAYPMDMELSNFLLVFCTVLIISLLSSWFPSSIASRQAMELKGQY